MSGRRRSVRIDRLVFGVVKICFLNIDFVSTIRLMEIVFLWASMSEYLRAMHSVMRKPYSRKSVKRSLSLGSVMTERNFLSCSKVHTLYWWLWG